MSESGEAMLNAYAQLGIEPCLRLDRDRLNAAFREAGKRLHPDAGGDEQAFAQLQLAHDTLRSPARRLKHWLEIKGLEVEARGSIGPRMMEWFTRVGEVSQQAEALIRQREAVRSALARALLEDQTHQCRESVEDCLASLQQELERVCGAFDQLEEDDSPDAAAASELHRELSFLEKWRASLRGLYARLV